MKTREKILSCTLELAAESGLGNVSLSKIAEKVGIRKATLFSHFLSKDEIIKELYSFVRERARKRHNVLDYDNLVIGRTAKEILQAVVNSYAQMNSQKEINDFYKFIYSERPFNPAAAMIIIEETETMMRSTRLLLQTLGKNKLLQYDDLETATTIFCLTIHALLDMNNDYAQNSSDAGIQKINDFITGFCKLYEVRK